MLLLDEVLAVDAETCHCRVTVHCEGVLAPFLDAQHALPSRFGLEIVAQTVAVWSGWHQCRAGTQEIALGMLLGARQFVSQVPVFSEGSVLDVHTTLLARDERIGSFETEIRCAGQVWVRARLSTCQLGDHELQAMFEEGSA